jgi:ribosomal protein S18 acetylase RimI-like enzyme
MTISKVTDYKDLEEILKLQKLSFKSEAIKHNDLHIPPMIQTLEDVIIDFSKGTVFLKYTEQNQIIGSVRAFIDKNNHCQIGRLVVHPDHQKKGIGTLLMKAIESEFKQCDEFKIFTGEKSDNVIALYQKLGYSITHYQNVGSHKIVHMNKFNS